MFLQILAVVFHLPDASYSFFNRLTDRVLLEKLLNHIFDSLVLMVKCIMVSQKEVCVQKSLICHPFYIIV